MKGSTKLWLALFIWAILISSYLWFNIMIIIFICLLCLHQFTATILLLSYEKLYPLENFRGYPTLNIAYKYEDMYAKTSLLYWIIVGISEISKLADKHL